MAAAPRLLTIDDYLDTPETVLPAELAYGELRVSGAPSPRHQSAAADLFRVLDAHVAGQAIGEMWLAPLDVVLDAARALVVQPDLMFVSNERSAIVSDRIVGAPDLVIEVLSPSARIGRTEEHLDWFARYGVRECWLVHLDKRNVMVVSFTNPREAGRHVFASADPIRSSVLPRFDRSLGSILHRW